MSCPICTETYTAKLRQQVPCSSCQYVACRPCVCKYLLSSINNPRCMNCKVEWSEDFIDSRLTKTFRNGELRKHREKVLIDREKARITETLPYAEMYRNIDAVNKVIDELDKEREVFMMKARELQRKITTQHVLRRGYYNVLEGRDPHQQIERREFVMKCPSDDCRGFLSTAWKCGMCSKHFCADCHAEKADGHECNEDAKATAAMIRRETHPCPKCGIRISKIDGCDQMWCTQCQTAFSWRTGQVVDNGRVHNPHYYEYLRRANNGVIPREPGDGGPALPFQCDQNRYGYGGAFERGMRLIWRRFGEVAETKKDAEELLNCFRLIAHIQGYSIVNVRGSIAAMPRQIRDATCDYLLNKCTEEELGKNLVRIERMNRDKRHRLQLLETFVQVGDQQIAECITETTIEKVKTFLTEMHKVREFINTSFEQLAKNAGTKARVIPPDWRFNDY